MNVRDSDFDRLLADWLEDDQFVAPTAPVEAAVAFARTHPRHRDWLAFLRRDAMATQRSTGPAVVIMLAIVAVLVLAVGGAVLIGSPASPTAPPSPTAPASSDAKQLEALLPDTVGGLPMQTKDSRSGREWVSQNQDTENWIFKWVTSWPLDDVSEARADAENTPELEIWAFRVKGVDYTVLLSTFETAIKPRYSGPWTTTILGGKTVQCRWGSGDLYEGAGGQCLDGTGDIIFIVSSSDRALVADGLAALP